MAQYEQHDHDMKMYGEIKLYAGSGSSELAQKIADYLKQQLSPREVILFPNENIFIKLNMLLHSFYKFFLAKINLSLQIIPYAW